MSLHRGLLDQEQPTTLTEGIGLMDMWDGLKNSILRSYGYAQNEGISSTLFDKEGRPYDKETGLYIDTATGKLIPRLWSDFNFYKSPANPLTNPVDAYLQGMGLIGTGIENLADLTGATDQERQQYDPEAGVLSGTRANFNYSAADEVKGIGTVIANPEESAQALYDVMSGALQLRLPDSMSWNEQDKEMAAAVWDVYTDRYGSLDGFKKSFAEDPVPILLELTGAGLIAKATAIRAAAKIKSIDPASFEMAINNIVEKGHKATSNTQRGLLQQNMMPAGINQKTEVSRLGFYSEAENVLHKLKQETNHPQHIRQFLAKNGVTNAEMIESGLLDVLESANKAGERVTKTGLLEHLADNRVELREEQLSGTTDEGEERYVLEDPEVLDNEHQGSEVDEMWEEIELGQADEGLKDELLKIMATNYPNEFALNSATVISGSATNAFGEPMTWTNTVRKTFNEIEKNIERTKEFISSGMVDKLSEEHHDMLYEAVEEIVEYRYQDDPYVEYRTSTPNDGDYLVTGSSDRGYQIETPRRNWIGEAEMGATSTPSSVYDSLHEAEMAIIMDAHEYGYISGGETKFSDYTLEGLDVDTYREIPIQLESGKIFSQPHFEENTLMHLRVSDRIDGDGVTSLFLEELQSDWHQKGRKLGYLDPVAKEANTQISKKLHTEFTELELEAKNLGLSIHLTSDGFSIRTYPRDMDKLDKPPPAPNCVGGMERKRN